MRLRRVPGVLIAVCLASAALSAGPVAMAKKKGGPVRVGVDAVGDWGANAAPDAAPLGDAMGQDLIGASINKPDAKNLEFIIELNSLPPTGGTPEAVRYVWDFLVDGELYELDGKWLNYTRGTCDPTAGTCPPPRDPGMQPFLVRTNCAPNATVTNLTTCEEVALVQGVFDTAAATITVSVPLKAIKAKPGSKITGGANIFGGNLSASPSAFVSSAAMPTDTLVQTKTYVVPK